MEFVVLGRPEIEAGALRELPEDYVVISVSDPDTPAPDLEAGGNCRDVLFLQFHDAAPVEGWAVPGGMVLMSEDQARRVWEFFEKWKRRVSTIVVHCEAGMSRSPAIAAALARELGEDERVFWERYHPNGYVYEQMLENRQPGGRENG